MRLLEIEVRNWRGLSLKLVGLSPRLNLILGPNESGKSRLFQAIRYALFESHKGSAQHKQLLQSWTSVEAPVVRVVFADGTVEFEIQKQFLKGASAQLTGGGKTLTGEDAEESLRNIVGTRQAGNRGAGTAELGIWPLLMVSQGESRKTLQEDLNDDGRSRLQERLSKEIGVAAISATGQRLMALAEQEYGRYFTASGQDAKVLRDTRAAHSAARAAFAVASDALQRQEQTATWLADQRRDLAALELRAQSAKRDAEAARVKSDASRVAEARVGLALGVLSTAVQRASGVDSNLSTRIEADGAVERLTRELTDVESQLDQRKTSHKDLEQELLAADQLVANSEESVRNARASADTAQRERRRLELNESHNDLSTRIRTLERVERDVAEARSKRATFPIIDAPCLGRLLSISVVAVQSIRN
jgi:hypothetical protein